MTTLMLQSNDVDIPDPDFLFEKPLSTFKLSDQQKAWIEKVVDESSLAFITEEAA